MASLDQIAQALKAADAAGDTQAAQRLAQAYKQAQAQQPLQLSVNPEGAQSLPAQTVATQPDALGSFADTGKALAHHLGNLPLGVAQLALHAPDAGKFFGVVPDNYPGESTVDAAKNKLDAYIQNREAQYQKETPTNASSLAGATIGEVAPWLVGIGELRSAGLLPEASTALGKAGALAAEGGLMGAFSPVTQGNYGREKAGQIVTGAVVAPLAAGAGAVAGKTIGAARNAASLLTDAGRNRLADQKLAAILSPLGDSKSTEAMLMAAPQYVPGERVSIAQALAPGMGGPKAVQIERALRNDPNAGPQLIAAQNANDAARRGVIDKIAGTDEQFAEAKAARADAAHKFTDENLSYLTPSERWGFAKQTIQNVLDNPGRMPGSDYDALKQAQKITQQVRSGKLQEDDAQEALNELRDSVSSKRALSAFDNAQSSIDARLVDPQPILDMIARARNTGLGQNGTVRGAMAEVAQRIKDAQDTRGMVPADVLDGLRRNMNELLERNKPNANARVGTPEQAGIAPVKSALAQALNERIPGYADYLAQYAQDSVPINTMEGVRGLVDPNAPGGLNASGGPADRAARIKAFLRSDDRAQHPISDDARAQIESVRNSLERQGIADNKIGTVGSDTAANLKLPSFASKLNASRGASIGAGLGAALGYATGVPLIGDAIGATAGSAIGGLLGKAAERANADVISRVGERASDAQQAALALRRARAGKSLSPLQRALLNRLLPYQSTQALTQ